MVNLIPPSAKKGVVIEYWLRVLTVWSFIATAVAILFGITSLPVYVLVDAKIDAYRESADVASQKIASYQSVSVGLNQATAQAQLLIANTRQATLSKVIELFNSLENNGIEITSMSITRSGSDGVLPVTLTGYAQDRQSLSDFKERLLAEEVVEVVDFPISNLAKDRDINFTLTVTMSNNLAL